MEWIAVIAFCAVMVLKVYLEFNSEPAPPSRFHMALYADSVRKRGISMEEAEEEMYIMGWTDYNPRLTAEGRRVMDRVNEQCGT